MRNLATYIRLFRETSSFVGSLSKVQSGIRSALRLFANEYQLDDAATDLVSLAIKKSMRSAVLEIATLTENMKTLVDYNGFLAGGGGVPKHVFDALVSHYLLLEDLSPNYPDKLRGEYCGQMIWRIADSSMKEALQDLCSAALADKE